MLFVTELTIRRLPLQLVPAITLIEKIATESPEIAVAEGGIQGVLQFLEEHPENKRLRASCLRSLERMSRCEEGLKMIASSGALATILKTVKTCEAGSEEDLDVAVPALKLFERISKNEGASYRHLG